MKIQKKICFFLWGGQDGCERRIKVFVKIQKNFFFFFWGVRVDVNREVKFL